LYYAVGACSLAPHIALEWIGAPYEAVKVQYGSDELRAVNAAGAAPTLREDDGWLLTPTGAILDYLAHKHPEAGLAGGVGILHLGRSLATPGAARLHRQRRRPTHHREHGRISGTSQ
jgi:glutathione S-transferase